MTPEPKDIDNETKKLMQEYLKNGGKITTNPPGARSEEIDFKGGFYQRRKKKKEEKEGKTGL